MRLLLIDKALSCLKRIVISKQFLGFSVSRRKLIESNFMNKLIDKPTGWPVKYEERVSAVDIDAAKESYFSEFADDLELVNRWGELDSETLTHPSATRKEHYFDPDRCEYIKRYIPVT
jgi:hypothetical protein